MKSLCLLGLILAINASAEECRKNFITSNIKCKVGGSFENWKIVGVDKKKDPIFLESNTKFLITTIKNAELDFTQTTEYCQKLAMPSAHKKTHLPFRVLGAPLQDELFGHALREVLKVPATMLVTVPAYLAGGEYGSGGCDEINTETLRPNSTRYTCGYFKAATLCYSVKNKKFPLSDDTRVATFTPDYMDIALNGEAKVCNDYVTANKAALVSKVKEFFKAEAKATCLGKKFKTVPGTQGITFTCESGFGLNLDVMGYTDDRFTCVL